jgi:hypothetical protein
MNRNQYIIQKIELEFKKHNICSLYPTKTDLINIFQDLEWNNIIDTIPEILSYYQSICPPISSKQYKLTKFFMEYITSVMISNMEQTTGKLINDFVYDNKNIIMTQFNQIYNAFDIVNIKYDRTNFLPFQFVLAQIFIILNRRDLAKLLAVGNINKFIIIWKDIQSLLN